MPRVEDGVVIGTASDKYQTRNPIARALVRGFDRSIASLARQADPDRILEAGCGEGHVTELLLHSTSASVVATDISPTLVEETASRIRNERVTFRTANAETLSATEAPATLVVCCEVLEHLHSPATALRALSELARPYCLMSVPREPLWRILNCARGAWLSRLGNSPGHIQHWSTRGFRRFVEREFDILAVRTPLPWTVILGRSRLA